MGIDLKKLPAHLKEALAVGAIHSSGGECKPLPRWIRQTHSASRVRRGILKQIGMMPTQAEHVETASWVYEGPVMGAPRMTQRDRWARRPCVERYHEMRDALRASVPEHIRPRLPQCYRLDWTAHLPVTESWSERKKAAHRGQRHRARPDRDNVDKAILDTLLPEDSGVAEGLIRKLWSADGVSRIEFTAYFSPSSPVSGLTVGSTTTTEETKDTTNDDADDDCNDAEQT